MKGTKEENRKTNERKKYIKWNKRKYKKHTMKVNIWKKGKCKTQTRLKVLHYVLSNI